MKFLIDQQLPPALAKFLQGEGHMAQHVREIGLKETDDRIIWAHARTNDMVLVSKDEDFYFLACAPRSEGKFLWVRIGNCRTRALLEIFRTQLEPAIAAFASGSFIVEIQ